MMDIQKFMMQPGEQPLDHLGTNGGFCGIFRLPVWGTAYPPVNLNPCKTG